MVSTFDLCVLSPFFFLTLCRDFVYKVFYLLFVVAVVESIILPL